MNLSSLLSQVENPTTRRAKRLRWIVVVLFIYTITGFFIAPAIIKSQQQFPTLVSLPLGVDDFFVGLTKLPDFRQSTRSVRTS